MNRVIIYLNRNMLLTATIGSLYYISTVLLHEEVSRISVWFQKQLTTSVYNDALAFIGLVMISVFAFYLFNSLRKMEDRKFEVLYVLCTLVLVIVAFHTLLTINAEYVHFFQYAILAVPIFALTLKFGETVFWVTLLGALDEAYQYFILYPDFMYFDFNDVILNLLGGGIGVILILSLLKKFPSRDLLPRPASGYGIRTPAIVILIILLSGFLIASLSGYVQFYPSPDSPANSILLNRGPAPSAFWNSVAWGKTYHILNPVEGMVVTGLLTGFYSFMDYRIGKKMTQS